MRAVALFIALFAIGGCSDRTTGIALEAPALDDQSPLPRHDASSWVGPDHLIASKDGISRKRGEDAPYSGYVIDFHPEGRIALRRKLVNGRADGLWLEWYPDGKLRHYSEWSDGLGHGPFMYFHDNGELRERAFAERDIWHGGAEGWSERGTKRFDSRFRNGERTEHHVYETEASQ